MDLAGWSYQYRIADYCFALGGTDVRLRDLARELYRAARTEGACPRDRFDLARLPGRFELRHERAVLATAPSLAAFFQEVERVLTETVMFALAHFYQVHAGAVAQGTRATLLIGPPEVGKTSLVLALAARQAAIYTDEVSLIEPRRLAVVPFPRDLIVHRESEHLLPAQAGRVDPADLKCFDGYRYVAPSSLFPQTAEGPARIVRLTFPRLCPGAGVSVRPLGQAEAARRVLEQTYNLDHWGAGGADLTARLVEQCPASEVAFGDAELAAARILELAAASPAE